MTRPRPGGAGTDAAAGAIGDEASVRAGTFPVVLAGPSGSGKTTVARRLARDGSRFRFSVSATTRSPRSDEEQGTDYQFVDRSVFLDMRESGDLLEWAEVHGELYGTPRRQLEQARREGVHLLLDIDVQGARSVRRLEPDVVTIFLLPPGGGRIVARLRGRGSEDEAERRRRLGAAREELGAVGEFDFVVVNDRLAPAVDSVRGIVAAEELRISRMGVRVSALARRIDEEIRRALDADGGPEGGPDRRPD